MLRQADKNIYQFLCEFANFWKATVNFVTSVCPAICPCGTTRLSPDGSSWNLILWFFWISVESIQFSLLYDKIKGFFTWTAIYIFITSCSVLLRKRNVAGKIKTPILCPKFFFPPKSCCFMDMEMYCTAREAKDNTMMCTTCRIPNVTNTHSVYVILFAFPLQ